MEVVVLIVVGIVVVVLITAYNAKMRREELLKKYGNAEFVEKIMRRMIWQGQTEGQLIDTLGKPLDIDERVLKTKAKETWKYNRVGKNRFALRVILENGVVVGWDQK